MEKNRFMAHNYGEIHDSPKVPFWPLHLDHIDHLVEEPTNPRRTDAQMVVMTSLFFSNIGNRKEKRFL